MYRFFMTLIFVALSSQVFAADFEPVKAALEKAMASEIRGDADRARDRNRKPIETLEFFELRQDSKVLELLPGGGWYTKLIAPVVRDEGELHLAIGADRAATALSQHEGFDKLNVTAKDASLSRGEGSRFFDLNLDDFGVKNLDIVFTFRNYHNLSEGGRATMNEASFKALKSGGIYAVVDHTRRHMEATNNENGRRIDPVLAIKEIEAAGFEFEDFSTLHYRADDELRYEVGRKSVTGNTDRWTLKFRKP
ncbi:MAG: methyltransferase [Pseudomonadales bacterium]|nr:methyltransferase [Pseudomonadales bacterium]